MARASILVTPVRLGNKVVSSGIIAEVLAYGALFTFTVAAGAIFVGLVEPEVDLVTAFMASLACVANVGPGLGGLDHANDFLSIPPVGRWVAMVQMLLGRLEIYPVILALSVITLRIPNALHPRRRAD